MITIYFSATALYYFTISTMDAIEIFDVEMNTTIYFKPLPISAWFPYDEQKYYKQSLCWQIMDGVVGSNFVSCTDVFTFSLIVYPIGQMRILNHLFCNIEQYAKKVQREQNCSFEDSTLIVLRNCLEHHKNIIRLIRELQNYYFSSFYWPSQYEK